MSSRMEKYNNLSLDNLSRTKRNQDVYNSMNMSNLSDIKTNTNVSVISDAPKEINLEKIRKFVYSLEENSEPKNRTLLELPNDDTTTVVREKEIKDYDINSVLERAKDNRESDYEEERVRKFNNTQIDILKNIKIKNEELQIEKDDDITEPIEELNTEEKTIVDLIKNIQSKGQKKDLFEDLMADDDDTMVTSPIDQEEKNNGLKAELLNITQDLELLKNPENDFTQSINLEKENLKNKKNDLEESFVTDEAPKIKEIDKSFYTNSMTFNKSDFEGFEDLEKGDKNGVLTKIAVSFIIILLIVTIFLVLNYVLDWNII